ncbi:hypothetical protein BGZ83_008446 [Gryganskiella cystojenkinii]|nr:hypothetical protein BGZ83_008446 [Gryganskiella cystojenkinii]
MKSRTRTTKGSAKKPIHRDSANTSSISPVPASDLSLQQHQQSSMPSMSPAAAMCVAEPGQTENSAEVNKAIQVIVDALIHQKSPGGRGSSLDNSQAPVTSMETEYIEALYAATPTDQHHLLNDTDQDLRRARVQDRRIGNSGSGSEEEEEDLDFDELGSYDDHGDDGDCEQDSEDEDLDAYEHDDFLSSQEAILMELRREQVEFEENVRQLQQQLQRQGSMLPLLPNDTLDLGPRDHGDAQSNGLELSPSLVEDSRRQTEPGVIDLKVKQVHNIVSAQTKRQPCTLCPDPKSSLCLENMGWAWRPLVVEALATAAAAITLFKARKNQRLLTENTIFLPAFARGSSVEGRPHRPLSSSFSQSQETRADASNSNGSIDQRQFSGDHDSTSSHHTLYPLPPNSPYTFRRKASEYLEPVGEFQEFQSAEGNSRQVLMHVWPPSELDSALLKKLETCCRDFQESEVVRGHSGDGFLNGWRPAWKQPNKTGVLRFGHWRVRSLESPEQLYAPFQTPLTLAAGGGSVLGSTVNLNLDENLSTKEAAPAQAHRTSSSSRGGISQQQETAKSERPVCAIHGHRCTEHTTDTSSQPSPDQQLESLTQRRLLRLIRAIQMVEKGIIARHLKYLFPTLYEKYHGLQFGTPRLFDAVATVAMAMDVAPRLHHDRAHTRHGFCWIIACGDFVGGDLCIPELGKRVVMRPGTVVAIRSTVVAYYIERYAKGTSMYTMYAYTADNCWPPALE